jgi:hypothetical protein
MSVGIAKCGLMEFLPNDTAITPLVSGQVVDGLALEGLPLLIVDRYMHLGILMTPGLTIESMVDHRICQGRAIVASMLPYLRCPVLPMSMCLVTVAVVVGPRLLFGAELYGMNRKLTDKMQVLMNPALCACIGARRVGNVPSVGLWKEVQTLLICALAGACRARAYAEAMGVKTWLRNMVLQPFRSQNWTWCSGVPRWIKRFALPHASTFIQTAYLEAGWQALDPAVLVEVVKACIMASECKLRRKVTRLTAAQIVWYEAANFGKTPLTHARVGGKPQEDQTVLVLILRCRTGTFVTIPTLVRCTYSGVWILLS